MTVSMESGSDTESDAAQRVMALPERLDVAICGDLCAELSAAMGRPLTLNASGVRFLGSMVLQLLIAARRQWAADAVEFRVTAPSAAFLSGLALLGYPQSPFEDGPMVDEVPA